MKKFKDFSAEDNLEHPLDLSLGDTLGTFNIDQKPPEWGKFAVHKSVGVGCDASGKYKRGAYHTFIPMEKVVANQSDVYTQRDVGSLASHLKKVKSFKSINVIDKKGTFEVEDGHHRYEVAKKWGMKTIPALVDTDED